MRMATLCAMTLCAMMLAAGGLAMADTPAADAPEPVSGVWQQHHIQFNYMGFTSTYSCGGLADTLRLLLRTAGARDDMKIATSGCPGGFGHPSRFASAQLTFWTLKPAGADAAGPTVAAQWRDVTLAPHRPSELSGGDCELIEQFRDRLLPLFATRQQQDYTRCTPHQANPNGFSLKFQSLAPVVGGSRR